MIKFSALGIDYRQVYHALNMKVKVKKQNKEVSECQRQVRNQARGHTSAITAVQR